MLRRCEGEEIKLFRKVVRKESFEAQKARIKREAEELRKRLGITVKVYRKVRGEYKTVNREKSKKPIYSFTVNRRKFKQRNEL